VGEPPARAPGGTNALSGTVRRASYLGNGVDYQVEVEDSDVVLRVAGPTPARARVGERVTLEIPPAVCIPLPEVGSP
jgi:TOBE domain